MTSQSDAERTECTRAHLLKLGLVSLLILFRTLCLENGATRSRLDLSMSINLRQSAIDMPRAQPSVDNHSL